MYVRYTRDAGLIEVRSEYMRLAEETMFPDIFSSMVYLLDLLGASKLEVHGVLERGVGGFMYSAILYSRCGSSNYWSYMHYLDDKSRVFRLFIRSLIKIRGVGVLAHDGVVKSIPHPVRNVYVKVVPLKHRNLSITLQLFKDQLIQIYGEKDFLERLYKKLIDTTEVPPDTRISIIRTKTPSIFGSKIEWNEYLKNRYRVYLLYDGGSYGFLLFHRNNGNITIIEDIYRTINREYDRKYRECRKYRDWCLLRDVIKVVQLPYTEYDEERKEYIVVKVPNIPYTLLEALIRTK